MSNTVEVVDALGNVQQVPIEKPAFVGDDGKAARELARSETGQAAAQAAAAEMLLDFAQRPSTPGQAEAAARMLQELGTPERMPRVGEPLIVAPAPVEVPGPVAEVLAVPSDYTLPDDWDEDDDEPELPAAAEEPVAVWDDDDLSADPRLEEARKLLDAANKRVEHERQLRVKALVPVWKQEAKQHLRIGDVELVSDEELASIDASSHREFRKKAREIADRNKKVVQRFAPSVIPAAPAPAVVNEDEIRAQIRAEEEAKARAQWGTPTVGGPAVESMPLDTRRRLERAQRQGDLKTIIRTKLYGR